MKTWDMMVDNHNNAKTIIVFCKHCQKEEHFEGSVIVGLGRAKEAGWTINPYVCPHCRLQSNKEKPLITNNKEEQTAYSTMLQEALEHLRMGVAHNTLMGYLETTDFFIAPASTKYHHAYQGGLCGHSIGVANQCTELLRLDEFKHINSSEAIFCALVHDFCKINFYQQTAGGYIVDEKFHLGHGFKSAYMVNSLLFTHHLRLTNLQAQAITFHMGCYTKDDLAKSFSTVINYNKLAKMLHTADDRDANPAHYAQ